MTQLTQLGQYRIEVLCFTRPAPAGWRVQVYRAMDMVRKRPVLLSVIEEPRSGDPQSSRILERVITQAQSASDLVHPHLGWVWETGMAEGLAYICERSVQGKTLAERLIERREAVDAGDASGETGLLSWVDSQRVVDQIAQGLEFAHLRGWAHGGLTPWDIWLSPELGAVVSGWGFQYGLAAVNLLPIAAPDGDQPPPEAARYLAPEALSQARRLPPADVYSLAVLWHTMLLGHPPQEDPLEFPADWPADTPWAIEPALERALSLDPARRYSGAADLASAPKLLASTAVPSNEERRRRLESIQQRKAAKEQVRLNAVEAARQAALEQARREIEEQILAPQAPPPPIQEPQPVPAISVSPPAQTPSENLDIPPFMAGYVRAAPDATAASEALLPPSSDAPAEVVKAGAVSPVSSDVGTGSPDGTLHSEVEPPASRPAPRRAAAVPVALPSTWVIWIGVGLVLAFFAGLWWADRPGGATATPTAPVTATTILSPTISPISTATQPALAPVASATPLPPAATPTPPTPGGMAPTKTAPPSATPSPGHTSTSAQVVLSPTVAPASATAKHTPTLTLTPTRTRRMFPTATPAPTRDKSQEDGSPSESRRPTPFGSIP